MKRKNKVSISFAWLDRVPEVVFKLCAGPVIFCYGSVCLNEEAVVMV